MGNDYILSHTVLVVVLLLLSLSVVVSSFSMILQYLNQTDNLRLVLRNPTTP